MFRYKFLIFHYKGAHYSCYYSKPLTFQNTGDKTTDTYEIMYQINQILESWIRERPEQWLWIHHRWDKSENILNSSVRLPLLFQL